MLINRKNTKSAADNIALIRADYEAGLCSKKKISKIKPIQLLPAMALRKRKQILIWAQGMW